MMLSIRPKIRNRTSTGFTLVEVLITMAIASFAVLGIISALIYVARSEAALHQENAAYREAAQLMDTTKRVLYSSLREYNKEVILDTDLTGVATLTFEDTDGNALGVDGDPLPDDDRLIKARVTVTWQPTGRGGEERSINIDSLIAPP